MRLPYEEELINEKAVLEDYLTERDICVPRGMSARRYLSENGAQYDFFEYKKKALSSAFSVWLKDHQIELDFATE